MLIPLSTVARLYGNPLTGVLHVGAHTGEENDAYRAVGIPQNSIYWVEAIPEIAASLASRLPNVMQAIVSDTCEPVEFKVTNNNQSSSILELKDHLREHPEIHVVRRFLANTTTLDNLVDQYNIRANMLNIDIQGAELKCLRGFERHLGDIDVVYTEVNAKELYAGCALVGELDEWLGARGFARVETHMTQHGWGEAIYLRTAPTLHLHCQGRGGNQLFQIATGTLLAKDIGCDLRVSFPIDSWSFPGMFVSEPLSATPSNAVDILPVYDVTPDVRARIVETLRSKRRYAFSGWFESWSHLKNHLDTIKTLFAFRTPPVLVEETIVHIRLGDIAQYLSGLPEYPHRVAGILQTNTNPITVISDSPSHPYVQFCVDVLRSKLPNRTITAAPKRSEGDDLLQMIQCSHLVGTNSTFVFWAGLLGSLHLPTKITSICVSDRLFAPARTESLYRRDPPDWCTVYEL